MKLDILVLSAHPDDAELGCGGTIVKHVKAGYKVGIVDFTKGELGTRGTPQVREKEAENSAKLLGLALRTNLHLPDGFLQDAESHQRVVIQAIRTFRPTVVLANAIMDRHPDHGKAADLAYTACFLAGLTKIASTDAAGKVQDPWRPTAVYHYIQSQFIKPDFIIDISEEWEAKMAAIRAFKSQFYDAASAEPKTYISTPEFQKMLEARAVELGHSIGVKYGEGFVARRWVGVKSLFDLI